MGVNQEHHVEVDDRPIDVAAEDRLGRSGFAHMLARALVERPQATSVVVALYGGWGSGKTSTLNLAFEALNDYVSGEQGPLLVRFNPWWYSNTGDLLIQFFAQLGGEFEKDDRLRSIKGRLLEYGQLLAPLGTIADLLGAGGAGSSLGGFLSAVFRRSETKGQERSQDPRALRAQIESAIKESGRRIVVVIDDIDRLSAEEIRDVFKLVKATADFPNTRYLLAFDFDTVTDALFEVQKTDGAKYLEKIVQLPFSLPEPSQGQLGDLLMDGMMQLAGDQDRIEEIELSRARDSFQWYRYRGLDSLIGNMRQLKRLLNSLSFTLPAVAGEVRLSDFFVLEILRVLYPSSYRKLLAKQGLLVGFPQYIDDRSAKQAKEDIRVAIEDISSAIETDTEGVVPELLSRMFPKVETASSNIGYSSEISDQWTAEKRVCLPAFFEVATRWALAPDYISEAEIQEILAVRSHPEQLRTRLTAYIEDPRSGINLTTLTNRLGSWYRTYAQPEDAVNLLQAIFPVEGGPTAESSLYLLGVDMLKRVRGSAERKKIILEALQGHEITPVMVQMMRSLGMEHGYREQTKAPEELRTLTAEDFREVEEAVAESIRSQAKDEKLLARDVFDQYLYLWEDISGSGPPRDYLSAVVSKDQTLVRLLQAYSERSDPAFFGFVAADQDKTPPILRVQLLDNFGLTEEARTAALAIKEASYTWMDDDEEKLLDAFLQSYSFK